jgi:hypothetical protein
LDAILLQADKLKLWVTLVEKAYARLLKADRKHVRFMLVSFRSCSRNCENVLELLPQQFTGELALCELSFGMDAAMALGKMELAAKLARHLPGAIRAAESPTMKSLLRLNLAGFFARAGKWDEAIAVLEIVRNDKIFCRDAVTGMVEIHAARALLAIKHGLALVEKFNREFDPKRETTLPGNDKTIQQQAEKQFHKLRNMLAKIVSEKRQKELGINSL